MATAQPISLPPTSNDYDLVMGSGSFTGQNGSFNLASYPRLFPGSPTSFRAGSFGSRFYPGVSPGQLLGPLDPNDFRFGKVSSSIESDRGSITNGLNVFDRQDELCRDYQCCGVNLTDMHALVDHFEECHVVVVDPHAPNAGYRNVPSGAIPPQGSYFSDHQPTGSQTYHQGSFNPDDMELDAENGSGPSSGSSSPPDTPISTPLSAYAGVHPHGASSAASTRPPPISAFDTTAVLPSRSGHAMSAFPAIRPSGPMMAPRAEDAFNAYAGYSDYSSLMPGTVPAGSAPAASPKDQATYMGGSYGARPGCVPPALLLNSSATTPVSTPSSSRVASPAPGSANFPSSSRGSPTSPTASSSSASQAPRASTTLSRPASSLLLSKPFKCPKPNCNKSYKQANGLKYHMTHGSCNFAPPKDLEQLQALLASKRSLKGEDPSEPMSDAELREVEKEAERRLRPYACGVNDCQRRYKNMNGLRYHYQHSGDHGAIGLALLASGQHECLQHTRAHHSRTATPASSSVASANTSPHATPVVSQAQAALPPRSPQSSPVSNAYSQSPPPYGSESGASSAYPLPGQQHPQYSMQHSQQQQVGYMMPPMSQ